MDRRQKIEYLDREILKYKRRYDSAERNGDVIGAENILKRIEILQAIRKDYD